MTLNPRPLPAEMASVWHVCHLILTLLTLGAWSVVWITHIVLFSVMVAWPRQKLIKEYDEWLNAQ